jgi:predicted patatin/cPLA2 family phospholipase
MNIREQIEEREKLGKAFVLRPPEDLRIGRTEKNPEELERVYQIGRETAGEAVDEIRRFLSADSAGERVL